MADSRSKPRPKLPAMVYTLAEETALLRWVNTFPLDAKVGSLSELTDGDIDPAYAIRDLDINSSPSKWLSKKKSLEAVYKSLLRYIHNHCDDLDSLVLENMVDINAIAEHEDEQQILEVYSSHNAMRWARTLANVVFKLLTIILMAAVRGTENMKFVRIITERLDASTQAQIAKIIQHVINTMALVATRLTIQQMEDVTQNAPSSPTTQDAAIPSTLAKDLDLALEAEHAALVAEHTALKKRHGEFQMRFERLQDSHDALLDDIKEKDHLLATLEDSKDGEMADYIQGLRKDLQEANDLIASQEQQMEVDRVARDKHQKELASLRAATEKLTEVEDQVTELKNENLNLSRKANMVDHFQKKLEAQSSIEKENANLRRRLETLEEVQKDYDKVYEENQKLHTTIQEYQRRFNSYELHVVELGNQKKVLEEDLRHREAQISTLTENKLHDERFIQDLQEQIRAGSQSVQSPPSADHEGKFLTLEQELEESEDGGAGSNNLVVEVSRLRTENQLLKSTATGTANATLRVDLEEADRNVKQLETSLNEITEKYVIAQEQLQAVIDTSSGDKYVIQAALDIGPLILRAKEDYRNEAVIHTRNLYLEATKELAAAKVKVDELTTELASKERELLSTKTDLASMGKEELQALEDLKSTNDIIKSSFEKDLLLLQSQHKNLKSDFDRQNAHLVQALLAKEQFREQVNTLKDQIVAPANPEVKESEATDDEPKEKPDVDEKNLLTEVRLRSDNNLPKTWAVLGHPQHTQKSKAGGWALRLQSTFRHKFENTIDTTHKYAFSYEKEKQSISPKNVSRHKHTLRHNRDDVISSYKNASYWPVHGDRRRSPVKINNFKHKRAFGYEDMSRVTSTKVNHSMHKQVEEDPELARELSIFQIGNVKKSLEDEEAGPGLRCLVLHSPGVPKSSPTYSIIITTPHYPSPIEIPGLPLLHHPRNRKQEPETRAFTDDQRVVRCYVTVTE
ncbi:hypothetical protein B7463_g2773, partial [Scytalidium lignicola]